MLLVVLLCSISGWSQKRIFDLYSSQVEKLYGIEVTKPEGFKVGDYLRQYPKMSFILFIIN